MLFHSNLLSVQSEGSLPEPFIMHTHASSCTCLVSMPEEEEEKGLGFQSSTHVPSYY